MKKTRFEEMQEQMIKEFGNERGTKIAESMEQEYSLLCRNYSNLEKSLIKHTKKNIFPVASAFKALTADGMSRKEAADISSKAFLSLMDKPADSIRKMLKFPFIYRLMPWLWKTLMPKMFGENAGFRFKFYPTDKKRVKFDMLKCPYYELCKELDCIEIAPTFCTTDDICYGNMHKNLLWNRTKTIARGGDVCDFDLKIKK